MKLLSLDPDRLGTIASTVCAIHCAVTGIAVSALSLVGFRYLQSPFLEWVLLGLALLFGSWAAARGFGIHKRWMPIILFGLGLSLLFGSHFFWPGHGANGSRGLTELFSVLGGVCLVGFHYLNRRFIKARA